MRIDQLNGFYRVQGAICQKKQYFKFLMKILLFFKGIVHQSTQWVAESFLAWQFSDHLIFSLF